jgi:hypothetical protein
MKARCLNPRNKDYKNYGGRGITICKEWVDSFVVFLQDMGPRPINTQLDRMDNTRGYSKDNCRWTTIMKNSQNRRSSKLDQEQVVEIRRLHASKQFTQKELAKRFHISKSMLCLVVNGKVWRNVPL